jgi:hypothetical protein
MLNIIAYHFVIIILIRFGLMIYSGMIVNCFQNQLFTPIL